MDSPLSLADLCILHLGKILTILGRNIKSTFKLISSFVPKEGRIHLLDMKDSSSKLLQLEIVADHNLKLNPHGIGSWALKMTAVKAESTVLQLDAKIYLLEKMVKLLFM